MPSNENRPDPSPPLDEMIAEVHTVSRGLPIGPGVEDDEERRGRGRPPVELTEELKRTINILGQLHCTYKEISAYTGISVDTLRRREDFRAVIDKGREQGKVSLRRAQFKSAIRSNNIVMQIWLGKQLLGQSEKDIMRELGEEGLDSVNRADDAQRLKDRITRIKHNLQQAQEAGNVPDRAAGTINPDIRLVDDDPSATLPKDRGLKQLPAPAVPEATQSFHFEQRVRHAKGPHFIKHIPNLDDNADNGREKPAVKAARRVPGR